MNPEQRIQAFVSLGVFLKNLSETHLSIIFDNARNENPWFTRESVSSAINGLALFLDESSLREWVSGYESAKQIRRVAVIMAGNIPLVGFHDVLSILISGHHAVIKLSSKDKYLINFVLDKLKEIEPDFESRIILQEQFKSFDAVIATGSDNSARYFDYYFGKYPHIIRKNKTSQAIISGEETTHELDELGNDVFTYFGLGCRNVSKLLVPNGYSFNRLFETWERFSNIIHHHKYCNNYDYQKSLLLINREPFLDNGFVLLRQSEKQVSPISVVFYDFYESDEDLTMKVKSAHDKIQVTVGKHPVLSMVPFGKSQSPGLKDYADNLDTMAFLSGL